MDSYEQLGAKVNELTTIVQAQQAQIAELRLLVTRQTQPTIQSVILAGQPTRPNKSIIQKLIRYFRGTNTATTSTQATGNVIKVAASNQSYPGAIALLQGVAAGGTGVAGESDSGIGVAAKSRTGIPLFVQPSATAPAIPAEITSGAICFDAAGNMYIVQGTSWKKVATV